MREVFHAELETLISELTQITRLAGQMLTNASTALHQADSGLAEVVISSRSQMTTLCEQVNQRCRKLLALHAPVATDLRMVVTAMRIVSDLERMGTTPWPSPARSASSSPACPCPGNAVQPKNHAVNQREHFLLIERKSALRDLHGDIVRNSPSVEIPFGTKNNTSAQRTTGP
jgi:hypothetical protein